MVHQRRILYAAAMLPAVLAAAAAPRVPKVASQKFDQEPAAPVKAGITRPRGSAVHPSGHVPKLIDPAARGSAFPSPFAAAQFPLTGTLMGPDGATYTMSVTLNQPPPPPPDPLTISAVTIVPNTLSAGQGATGTVLLSRSPGQTVQVVLTAEKGLTADPAVTIQPGQTSGTFSVKSSGSPAGVWLSVIASYNGQSKLASVFVQATPQPPPPTAGPPVISGILNPDGRPLTLPQWGQEVRIEGMGFGASTGTVRWQGGSVPVTLWSDSEVRVRLPLPTISGAQEFSVMRPDGLASDAMVPQP